MKVEIYFPKLVFANMWLEAFTKKLIISNFQLVMNFKNFIKYLKVQIYFPKLVFANMWPEAMAKKLFISIKVSYEFLEFHQLFEGSNLFSKTGFCKHVAGGYGQKVIIYFNYLWILRNSPYILRFKFYWNLFSKTGFCKHEAGGYRQKIIYSNYLWFLRISSNIWRFKFIFQNWFLQTCGRRLWPKNYLFQLFMNFKNFVKYLKVQIYFPRLVFGFLQTCGQRLRLWSKIYYLWILRILPNIWRFKFYWNLFSKTGFWLFIYLYFI